MRSALFAFVVLLLASAANACSTDTSSPSGPLPGDVIAADASPDDIGDASSNALTDATTTTRADATTTDAASTRPPDAASPNEPTDATVDDDF